MLRQTDDPAKVLPLSAGAGYADAAAVFQWASAAQKAHIYLLSGLDSETAEELFTTPLDRAEQVQRLLASEKSCLILPDANKALRGPCRRMKMSENDYRQAREHAVLFDVSDRGFSAVDRPRRPEVSAQPMHQRHS